MKTQLLALALSLIAAPCFATQVIDLDSLAAETGLSTREVAMVLGPHSAFTEYRASYDHVRRQFRNAIGRTRYDTLIAAWNAQQQGRNLVVRAAAQPEHGT
ncbi:MAG: hypothetical protein ABI411_04940 [Tahibacter sp.]